MASGGRGEEEGNGRVVEGTLFGAGEVEDGRMTKDTVRTVVTFHPEEDVCLKQPVGEEGRRGEGRERKKWRGRGRGRERKGKKRREEREKWRGRREGGKGGNVRCSHYKQSWRWVRATDLTIFWLVSGVANGRKASDGLTRVEQIYNGNKNKGKKIAAFNQLSNSCN